MDIVNFLFVKGQVNDQNELVRRKFYLSNGHISFFLSVLKQFTLLKTV